MDKQVQHYLSQVFKYIYKTGHIVCIMKTRKILNLWCLLPLRRSIGNGIGHERKNKIISKDIFLIKCMTKLKIKRQNVN